MGAGLMKTTTEMKLVPIVKLVPYVNNARTHSPEQINKLRSSLREFGFINPVIIDRDYGVIAGHGRILAAKEEGITEVPCVFADHLTEAQKKAYIIADNRMAMDAGWDEELLRVEIESLQAADFDPLLTGFDEKELSKLFDDGIEAKEDDFDVDAELQKPTFTKPGDIWTLGRHRLICGDSTKGETYTALMDGRKANLVITDPPYNVNYEGSAGKIKNDNMASEKFFDFLFDAFSNMEKVMADDASIYVFHADTEGLNFRKAFDAAGFYLSGCCIDIYLRYIVPNVMKKHRMDEIIQVAREYPCFEDFDFRKSNQKTDFIRKWYHTRTKHPMISLEEFQEAYADAHGGQEYEEPDPSQNVEETVVAQALVDQFKATLSEKDMQILELRMSGDTLEKIAEKLGYKNHSGVLKRIRKIGQAYEAYTGVDYGFENDKITG